MDKMTRKEAAEALGVSTKTLALWEKNGKIPPAERDWRGWRVYDAETVAEIRRTLLGDERAQPTLEIPAMVVSTPNRLPGYVKSIAIEGLLAEVTVALDGGLEIVASISRSSLRRMGLRVGDRVLALLKPSDVILAR